MLVSGADRSPLASRAGRPSRAAAAMGAVATLTMGVLAAAAMIAAAGACSRPGDEAAAKRASAPEPPPSVDIPGDLAIPVEARGAPIAAITRDRLAALPPDYEDDDRRAWRLTALLGDALPAGGAIEAIGRDGVSLTMKRPAAPGDPQPVLVLTRRGDVAAAAITPEQPFPGYHGHGGRLHRPGDPRPRISPVVKLRITGAGRAHRDGADPADPADPSAATAGSPGAAPAPGALPAPDPGALAALAIVVDGQTGALSAAQLRALPTIDVRGDSGQPRPAWPVRALAELVAGDGARLTDIAGADHARVAVDAALWRDGTRTPVLRVNQSGLVKFQWLDTRGQPTADQQMRGVHTLSFTSAR